MHALAEQLLKTIRKQEALRAGDRVAAAVSGGGDSVALLCLLLELRAELGIVLSVAHVNHKLRGEESDEDERFVAKFAGQHGLELHVCEAPDSNQNPDQVVDRSSGIEATARELRYKFFRQLAREGRVTKIATAHTLDDQAETVLLRIFRGTGIRGLSSIHPRVSFEEQGRTFGEVVRPLLGFRRAALQEFLRERGQSWREDSSNHDIAFLRNRVRQRLLPIIGEEFGDAAIEHMGELAEIARAEEEHWEHAHPEMAGPASSEAEQAVDNIGADDIGFVSGFRFSDTGDSTKSDPPSRAVAQPEKRGGASLPAKGLLALPLAAQRRLVHVWLKANAGDLSISFRLIEEVLELARGVTGKKLELTIGRNLRLTRQRGRKELLLESEPGGRGEGPDYKYVLEVPGVVWIPELGVRFEALMVEVSEVPENDRLHLLDLDRMPKEILIRNWHAGDRFWPAHAAAPKKVKELLSDRHLTGIKKKLWPVATAEGCGLVWMRGFAVPEAYRAPSVVPKAIWIRELACMM
jgi:tRNA(Ile)-lysidine synthase